MALPRNMNSMVDIQVVKDLILSQARSLYCEKYPTGTFDVVLYDQYENPNGTEFEPIENSFAQLIVYPTPHATSWVLLEQSGHHMDVEEVIRRLFKKLRKASSKIQGRMVEGVRCNGERTFA